MIITIFEDQNSHSLYPLNHVRASFELRCGVFTNLERIQHNLTSNDEIQLFVRDEIKSIIRERFPHYTVNPDALSPGIWLNGQVLWTKDDIQKISLDRTFTHKGRVIAIHNSKTIPISEVFNFIGNVASVSMEMDVSFIDYAWDLIFMQDEIIRSDSQDIVDHQSGKIHPSVVLENADNIYMAESSEIRPGVVLDASTGPIIISDHVLVDIGSLIQGPVYIGPDCTINPGAKLRKNVTLGPMCKIGGELESVIFQGYGNKQHDGFLGHSYVGEWVNLGANTNNSDLKNNYGLIQLIKDDQKIETGKQFLGTMMGDYSRTGISTMLNTGTIIGLGANIFGAGFQDKYIPSFRWGKNDITELEKLFNTVENMKQRRGKSLSSDEKIFLTELFEKQIIK